MATDARQVAEENVAAFNAHDRDALRASYAAGAVTHGPGLRLEGPDHTSQ